MGAGEVGVGAFLHDPALVQDDDPVRDGHVGEPVGDQQDRAVLGQFAQAGEDPVLRPRVQGGGGLVYHQQRRLPVEGAGEDEPLPLAAGELLPAATAGSAASPWPKVMSSRIVSGR